MLTETTSFDPTRPIPSASPASLVILTDVDGVLRRSDTRSIAEARPALDVLAERRIPVVLCSEHSASELMWLQHALGMRQPFICESGAAVYIPRGYFVDVTRVDAVQADWEVIEFGIAYPEVAAALRRVATTMQIPVVGFDDLGVEQLSRELGLTIAEAQLAKCRHYDEPFRIVTPDPQARARLFAAMRDAGYRCYSRPRYHHATAVRDGGAAIRVLISLYRAYCESAVIIGLGDDGTDRALLREADVPVVVRNDTVDQSPLLREFPFAYLTSATGPAGWREAILGGAES